MGFWSLAWHVHRQLIIGCSDPIFYLTKFWQFQKVSDTFLHCTMISVKPRTNKRAESNDAISATTSNHCREMPKQLFFKVCCEQNYHYRLFMFALRYHFRMRVGWLETPDEFSCLSDRSDKLQSFRMIKNHTAWAGL